MGIKPVDYVDMLLRNLSQGVPWCPPRGKMPSWPKETILVLVGKEPCHVISIAQTSAWQSHQHFSCFIASQFARDVGPHSDHWECWKNLQCHWLEGKFPMQHLIASPSLSLCSRSHWAQH